VCSLVLLCITAGAAVLLFARQGNSIEGTIDGRIDVSYYHSLITNNRKIANISEIEDLLAEVYYLTHGEDVRQFRFTFYDAQHKPLRVLIMESIGSGLDFFGERYPFFGIGGMNWGNGDIYIAGRESAHLLGLLNMTFHELGHGLNRSHTEQFLAVLRWVKAKLTGNLGKIEADAECNVLDSAIALMYLDPDLGYTFFCASRYGKPRHDFLFSDFPDEYSKARNFSLYQALMAGRAEEYSTDEVLQANIEQRTSGQRNNDLIDQVYRGVLAMFKARFGDRDDFEDKFFLLEHYMQYGVTDNSYEKAFIPDAERMEKVKRKEKFLEQEHSALIRENLMKSLLNDYREIDEAKAFSLFNRMIAEKTTAEWTENISFATTLSINDLEWALKYAYREGEREKASELLALLRKANEKNPREWLAQQIAMYEPYLSN